jgi:hypothetical protein
MATPMSAAIVPRTNEVVRDWRKDADLYPKMLLAYS